MKVESSAANKPSIRAMGEIAKALEVQVDDLLK